MKSIRRDALLVGVAVRQSLSPTARVQASLSRSIGDARPRRTWLKALPHG